MDAPLSLEEVAKLQVPALRHDAQCLDAWVHKKDPGVDVCAIAERLLRLHTTIDQQGWLRRSATVHRGLEVLEQGIAEHKPADQLALLTNLLVAMTRAMLGDDPGPEPHGGPLAAQMAIGARKRV